MNWCANFAFSHFVGSKLIITGPPYSTNHFVRGKKKN